MTFESGEDEFSNNSKHSSPSVTPTADSTTKLEDAMSAFLFSSMDCTARRFSAFFLDVLICDVILIEVKTKHRNNKRKKRKKS